MELHGNKKTKKARGCLQQGIFPPFHWSLVVDSLLNNTKNPIPCDIQGFADDMLLIATLESPSSNEKGGFDADILRGGGS